MMFDGLQGKEEPISADDGLSSFLPNGDRVLPRADGDGYREMDTRREPQKQPSRKRIVV